MIVTCEQGENRARSGRSRPREQASDDLVEGFEADGFGDVVVAAGGEGSVAVALQRVRGDRDDGDRPQRVVVLALPDRLPPVHAGKPQFQDDEVGHLAGGGHQRLGAVAGGEDLVVVLERGDHEFQVVFVILDHEHSLHGNRSSSLPLAAARRAIFSWWKIAPAGARVNSVRGQRVDRRARTGYDVGSVHSSPPLPRPGD